jgi:thermopsin
MSARRITLVVVVVIAAVMGLSFGILGASSGAGPAAAVGPVAATSSVHASPLTTAAAPSSSSRLALEQRVLATTQDDHLPIEAASLPDLVGPGASVSNGVVTPSYTTSPAPMGIGTYGVLNSTGTAQAISFTTSSWEGSITLNNVNTFLLSNDGAISTNGAENTFGVQLNAVMNGVTLPGSDSNAFWTQNVLYFNYPYPGTISFLDNIWNFSSPAFNLAPGTLYSYGGTPVYPEYYYDFGPTFSISLPITVHLFLTSSVTNLPETGYGYSTVSFGFAIANPMTGATEASGVYDTVLFNSMTPIGSVPAAPYLVDGSQLTPTGFIPWDAEIMIGGPGGGTTTSVYGISGSESLDLWDATTDQYVAPPSAWNVGSETGETSEGISETYTTPGTVQLGAGPSMPAPFWDATPGGNIGQATVSGSLSPTNAFVFFNTGNGFDPGDAAWAPTQDSTHEAYVVPPGTYTVTTMLSDYTPTTTTVHVRAGQDASINLGLHPNFAEGVYTPLDAWSNAQFAAISFAGSGTAGNPYIIVNNPARGGLNPVFAQSNDYLYPVFPGLLFAGTTAHVDLDSPSLFPVTYPSVYDGVLEAYGLPLTNNLQFEVFDASNISIWHAQGITGWFFFEDYGPSGYLPLANVVIWGGSNDLVGDSTFVSQGSSLVLAGVENPTGPSGNVVWGNTFVNSTALSPAMYPGDGASNGPPIAIFAFEGGDLIYNNYVATSITAYAPDANMFTGAPQLNLESWNLPMVEPAWATTWVNGYALSGTIVRSAWQGGNFWADYVPGSPLPYDEYGFIQSGGDYFPLPITAFEVTFTLSGLGHGYGYGSSVEWSVTVNGVTQTTSSNLLVFYETPGAYSFSAAVVHGSGSISPSTGTVTVSHHNVNVSLSLR